MPARPPLQEIDEVEEYLFRVKEMCGELCDYTKEVVPGKLLGTVSSKVSFLFIRERSRITLAYFL